MGRHQAVCDRRGRFSHGRGCTAALAVAALLAAVAPPASGTGLKEDSGVNKEKVSWLLPQHSFERTLTYDDRLGDWLQSAATMALRDRVQILPPVADRYGLFWNKRATDTQGVDWTLNFRAMPQKGARNQDGQFAFWMSPENFTASFDEQAIVTTRDWAKGLKDAGLTFLGNRPKTAGFGVFFLSVDQRGRQRPSVTAAFMDGQKELDLKEFPGAETVDVDSVGRKTTFIDWRTEEVELKIHCDVDYKFTVTLQVSKSEPAKVIYSVDPEDPFYLGSSTYPFRGQPHYFGFSGWTGSKSFLELDMSRFEMRSFDTKHIGELAEQESEEDITDVEAWKKVLAEEKRYIDQKDQKEAVERLTKLLGDYVEKYNKMGEKVKTDLVWLEKRMQSLDTDVGTLISSSKAVNPETGNVEAASLKDHIVGIRSILTRDKDVHDEKLSRVHEVAKSLKEKGGDVLNADGRAKVASVAELAKTLEKHVNSGTTQTSSLLFVLVLAVCALGLLFLNRMRYYEKKHYI